MRRYVVGLILGFLLAYSGVAQAQDAKRAGGSGSWDAVKALKPGTKVVVEQLLTPGDYRDQTPCWVMRVDEESLTCSPVGKRRQRIVYPARQVLTVYQVRMRVTAGGWVRTVLYAGAGFLVGCAITDENDDYELGAVGAVAGALAGAERGARPKFTVVYRRMEPSAGEAVSP
jgi:hypothetical protein